MHTPIILNPSDYHYAALQEICVSLNSGNIKIPNQKPAIIYFEWNTNFSNNLEKITNYETLKEVFIKTYKNNKTSFLSIIPTSLESIQTKVILKIRFMQQIQLNKN